MKSVSQRWSHLDLDDEKPGAMTAVCWLNLASKKTAKSKNMGIILYMVIYVYNCLDIFRVIMSYMYYMQTYVYICVCFCMHIVVRRLWIIRTSTEQRWLMHARALLILLTKNLITRHMKRHSVSLTWKPPACFVPCFRGQITMSCG